MKHMDGKLAQNVVSRATKYWHLTSDQNAKAIVRQGLIKPGARGNVHAYIANSLPLDEAIDDVVVWFRGRGLNPRNIAVVEFTTDQPREGGTGGAKWKGPVSIDGKIIKTVPFKLV